MSRRWNVSSANSDALSEVGRLFGRVAHLLDAVEDLAEDSARGAWNPLLATGTGLDETHRLCRDAVRGIRLALDDVAFGEPGLARALLVHELDHAVRRVFGHAGHLRHNNGTRQTTGNCRNRGTHQENENEPNKGNDPSGGSGDPTCRTPEDSDPHTNPADPTASGTDDGTPPSTSDKVKQPQDGDGGGCCQPKFRVPPRKRNAAFGCLVASYMCCSCQFCCRDPLPGPWSGEPRENACHDCCDNCDCCDGCDCSC